MIISGVFAITLYEYLLDKWYENLLKYLYISLILLLLFSHILQNNITIFLREKTYLNYYSTLSDIYTKATELEDYKTEMKWMFNNIIKYYSSQSYLGNGFISNTYETWNNYTGTTQPKIFYDKYFGISISICDKSVYDLIVETDEFKKMPIYPEAGSINIIKDTVVIKISEDSF